jgi:hypothetical protein
MVYRVVGIRAAARMLNAFVAPAMASWKRFASAARQRKIRLRKAVRLMHAHSYASAWRGWVCFVDRQRERSQKLEWAVRLMHSQNYNGAWRAWVAFVWQQVHHRLVIRYVLPNLR